MESQRRPFSLYVLLLLIFLQALSGLFGGYLLMADPISGGMMKMPIDMLKNTPFPDFFLPGLILFFVLGVFPTITFFALIVRKDWYWVNALNIFKNEFFGWTFALYVGIMLVLWMNFEIFWVGYGHPIQTVYAFLGILIVIFALMPPVQNYYRTV